MRNIPQIIAMFTEMLKHRLSLDNKNDSFQNRKSRAPLLPRSGRPVAAVSPEMLQHADSNVRYDRRMTTRQLARCLLIRKGGICHSIRDLGYGRCARSGALSSSQMNKKPSEKQFLLTFFYML